jgi:hypothetical protein
VGESVVAMKLGLLLFEAAAIWALIALLQRQGAPATRIALYAWHPLPSGRSPATATSMRP